MDEDKTPPARDGVDRLWDRMTQVGPWVALLLAGAARLALACYTGQQLWATFCQGPQISVGGMFLLLGYYNALAPSLGSVRFRLTPAGQIVRESLRPGAALGFCVVDIIVMCLILLLRWQVSP